MNFYPKGVGRSKSRLKRPRFAGNLILPFCAVDTLFLLLRIFLLFVWFVLFVEGESDGRDGATRV